MDFVKADFLKSDIRKILDLYSFNLERVIFFIFLKVYSHGQSDEVIDKIQKFT